MTTAVIVDAVRTPGGRRNGKLQGWHAADPRVDALQARLSWIVEGAGDRSPSEVLDDLRIEILSAAGRDPGRDRAVAAGGPRLTEPWFC